MKAPVCLMPDELARLAPDVAIAGEPWDGTGVSLPGARLGPQAIRTVDGLQNPPADRPHQHVRVDPMAHLRLVDYGDAEVFIGDTQRTHRAFTRHVEEILDAGAIPVMLGGDHSVTLPNVIALSRRHGADRIAVVQIDAHSDTADVVAGTRVNNSTGMRRLIEGEHLHGRHLHQIGLRGYWPADEELAWMEQRGIRAHFMAEVEADGIDAVVDRVIDDLAASGADQVWLTFDVDGVDPAYAPGTGSPEPGGLTSREALRAVRRLTAETPVAGMDVVEVNPLYDTPGRITALLAHRVILEALTGIAMRRIGKTERAYVDERSRNGLGA